MSETPIIDSMRKAISLAIAERRIVKASDGVFLIADPAIGEALRREGEALMEFMGMRVFVHLPTPPVEDGQ
jgi:hypothetical protein